MTHHEHHHSHGSHIPIYVLLAFIIVLQFYIILFLGSALLDEMVLSISSLEEKIVNQQIEILTNFTDPILGNE